MPCVSLGHQKTYRAKIMKSSDVSVNEATPVSVADLTNVSAEVEELVNVAAVAEEVLQSEHELTNPQSVPITSAHTKPPKQPLYYKIQSKLLRPAEVKNLRRAAVKAARHPAHKTADTPVASANSAARVDAELLLDGTKVQIRAHRAPISRIGREIIQAQEEPLAPAVQPEPASVASIKSARSSRLLAHTKKATRRTAQKLKTTARQMHRRPTRAELINAESKLGSTIFGPVPAGHRREFFHDRENVWLWHEDWIDHEQHQRQLTVRYEVRPSGVYKKISAGKYIELKGAELENFRQATKVYLHIIKQKLYARAK